MHKLKIFLITDPGKYWIAGFIMGAGAGIIITGIILYIRLANYKLVWY